MAMKMDVWQWGDVKGVDEELCNNLALFAEDNKIDCMNMTEKEFVALKDEYLMTNYGNKGVFLKKSMKEEIDTSVVGTNKDKTKKYAHDFLKEWYKNIVVESLMNDDGDYVLKVGFYDDLLKKDPSIMDKVSAKLSGNSRFLQMLDDDTACKLVVYDVNNPRKYEVYWL